MKARYLNPFTDFGFKKLFGEEASKPLLMDFLNALLPLESPITELSFRNAEQLDMNRNQKTPKNDHSGLLESPGGSFWQAQALL